MSAPVLVCFAVKQEAKPFQKRISRRRDVRVIITGMGARNAEKAVRLAVKTLKPALVYSCGFAGALDPDLRIGDVVCTAENPVSSAKPVTFLRADRVAITAAEKSALRASTGADAVEMESAVITRVCHEAGVQCVTLRVISDTAREDLPLDFNALLTPGQNLGSVKLAWAVLRAPQKIPALMRLGRNSALAAQRLADVLAAAI